MRILITEFMDEAAVAALAARFNVRHDAGLAERRVELLGALGDIDAVIVRNRTRVDRELLASARGGGVDEAALVEALRAGRLGGAALDVFEHEPVPAGSPLAGVPNLVLTPHVAGVTREANARVSSMIAAKVAEALVRR